MAVVFIILGMHRSGTSAVTGVLAKLGGQAPKHPMAANQSNPKGYFESEPLRNFHDGLLASVGSGWRDWKQFDPSWYETSAANAFRQQAIRIFKEEFASDHSPLIKDPRMCRFVPFWLDTLKLLNAIPRFIIPVRSPLDVAMSLTQRNGISLAEGLLLWLRHVLDSEFHTRGEKRSIFALDQFMADWRTVTGKIAEDLSIAWPKLHDRTCLEIDEFLEKDLVHYNTSTPDLVNHLEVHESIVMAYETLLELAHDTSPRDPTFRRLDEIRAFFDRATALFTSTLDHYQSELQGTKGELLQLHRQHDALSGQVQTAKAGGSRRDDTGMVIMRKILDFRLFRHR